MIVSELVAKLQKLQTEHGDVLVGIDDADTDWRLGIETCRYDPVANCVLVRGEYGGPSEIPCPPGQDYTR